MKLKNGQPVRYKPNYLYTEFCCDCGLAHIVIYRIIGKQIEVTSYRDQWETLKNRKNKKKRKRK